MHAIAVRLRNITLTLIAVLVTIGYQAPLVMAAGFTQPPETTNKQKAHLNINFTGGGNGPSACDANNPTAELSGADNLEKIYNFMTSKGLSPEQAAGIIGNISVESGGDPQIVQGGGRSSDPGSISAGWGIIQWTPGSKIIGLLANAHITTPPDELNTQLELVWWHMNNTSPTGVHDMHTAYQNISDVKTATVEFEDKMEGAGEPHIDVRIQRAQEALRKFGGGATTSNSDTAPVSTSCTSDTSDGGTASLDGFTFPLITTQAALKKGSSLGGVTLVWCYSSQTYCHHDYKAADLMIPTGTTVIAAKDGKVQNINGGNQHPNNVTITSDDGKGINYYTHMGANTVVVRIGQHLTAGTVLGKVGTSVDAMGTAPHLHFDMLPPQFKYRPACSGPSCSGLPFIEVQPVLIETFKKLPES